MGDRRLGRGEDVPTCTRSSVSSWRWSLTPFPETSIEASYLPETRFTCGHSVDCSMISFPQQSGLSHSCIANDTWCEEHVLSQWPGYRRASDKHSGRRYATPTEIPRSNSNCRRDDVVAPLPVILSVGTDGRVTTSHYYSNQLTKI